MSKRARSETDDAFDNACIGVRLSVESTAANLACGKSMPISIQPAVPAPGDSGHSAQESGPLDTYQHIFRQYVSRRVGACGSEADVKGDAVFKSSIGNAKVSIAGSVLHAKARNRNTRENIDIWGASQLRAGCLSILMFHTPLAPKGRRGPLVGEGRRYFLNNHSESGNWGCGGPNANNVQKGPSKCVLDMHQEQ